MSTPRTCTCERTPAGGIIRDRYCLADHELPRLPGPHDNFTTTGDNDERD